ncbi:prophage lp2 protein 56, lysin [Lactobacillus selangorensis]|uniref:Prophage lp2 protein 56, lysin n=2 Tax=Lactobacillus selangorensis TaxID=81857 RepID=A0A0R2FVB2_9LACO|nr:prophage lp2 protein 56, lysin [Lactobacillus selangorensis]KRN31398.1 prophage lp2 protein 56, lysin [Lactobacillus selangorensis]
MNGIDVASYQAGMMTAKISADFVISKATEGTNYVNPACAGQINGALAGGKRIGLYHFASGGDSKQEADYFISAVQGWIGKAILVLDYEAPAVKNGATWAKTWLDYVSAKTGVRPLIYLGLSDENAYDWSTVAGANYGLWIAQYNNYNPVYGYAPRDLYGALKYWKSAAMFQYTSSGRLGGWDGPLDFDVFYGDESAWDKYAKKNGGSTPVQPSTPSKPDTPVSKLTGFTDSLGDRWYNESGSFKLNQPINLRWGAKISSKLIGTLQSGASIKYDAFSHHDGYVWLRQPRSDGYGYLASGESSGGKRTSSWGTFS